MVAGHGRVEQLVARKQSGQPAPERIEVKGEEWLVPVIRGIEFKDEKEAEAYLLADNQTTILGGWNENLLTEILKDHMDHLDLIGFKPSDLEAKIPNLEFTPIWEVAVSCDSEQHQQKIYEKLKEMGLNCRPLTL